MAKPISKSRHTLTDAQWAKLAPFLPHPKPSPKGGRPWSSERAAFEGILWILWTGAPWSALPKTFPSPSTCWRRLRDWEADGTWETIWRAFLTELDDKAKLDWQENFIDGSFAAAKKGGPEWDSPAKARERSGWWWWTVKECLWQPISTRQIRARANWSRRPWKKSESRGKARLVPG